MVARRTCNKTIGGSNPVTVIFRTSVPGIFSHFQDKTKSQVPPFARCFLAQTIWLGLH